MGGRIAPLWPMPAFTRPMQARLRAEPNIRVHLRPFSVQPLQPIEPPIFSSIMSTAIVFPGQGSQAVGMLAALAAEHPQVEATFQEASEALGCDLWALASAGPAERLNRTENTQPALLAAGVAVWRVWQAAGGARPVAMAGHSLGEYTALVCAGALGFPEAIRLVAERGKAMQAAVPAGQGAMAALLGLDDAAVERLCAEASEGDDLVSAANYNSPGQVVIAGAAPAVERAIALAKTAGAKRAVALAVSVPSHCALMQPAAERLRGLLEDIALTAPAIPVIQNVDAAAQDTAEAIRDRLIQQLSHSVLWTESVRRMAAMGVDRLIEAGPGKVLAGLTRRIDKGVRGLPVFDPATLATALEAS